jgi:hypothetical protein
LAPSARAKGVKNGPQRTRGLPEPAPALCHIAGTKPFWSRLTALCGITVRRRLWLVGQGKSHLYGFALLGNISKAAGVVQAHSHLIERAGHQVDSRDARGDRHLHQRRHEQTRDAHAAIELPGHNKTDIGKEPVRIYPYLRKIVDTHIVQPIGTWAVVSEHLDGVWSTRPALRGRVATRTLAVIWGSRRQVTQRSLTSQGQRNKPGGGGP